MTESTPPQGDTPEPIVDRDTARPSGSGNAPAATIGVVLVILGALLLGAQFLDYDLGEVGWPFYVIAPGVALLVIGLTQRNGQGLAIAGSIVTIVGLVLFYQNVTDHWESWAYAWALVGPGGSGVGMFLYGLRGGDGAAIRAGFWQILIALGIFVVGFAFFEGVIGISGERLPIADWVLPVIVIGLGLVVLVRGLTWRRDESAG